MTRPSWDDTWLQLAVIMSARSWCKSGAGAVAVGTDRRVIQTGYAGPPATYALQAGANLGELELVGCAAYCPRPLLDPAKRDPGYTDCPSVHAEINCIAKADSTRMPGGSFYVSSVPCFACAKAICNTGIAQVVWYASPADTYRDPAVVKDFFSLCNVHWEEVKP
jgi:dCMP deaminase